MHSVTGLVGGLAVKSTIFYNGRLELLSTYGSFAISLGFMALLLPLFSTNETHAVMVLSILSLLVFNAMANSSTIARAYFNERVFQKFRKRLILVPLVLVLGVFTSELFLFSSAVMLVLFEMYHVIKQNFGISIYYKKSTSSLKVNDYRLANIFHYGCFMIPLIYNGKIIHNYELVSAGLTNLGLSGLAEEIKYLDLSGPLMGLTSILFFAFGVYYFYSGYKAKQFCKQGLIFEGTLALSSLFFVFKFNLLGYILFIQAYHAIQTFGFTLIAEHGNMSSKKLRYIPIWLLFGLLMIATGFIDGVAEYNMNVFDKFVEPGSHFIKFCIQIHVVTLSLHFLTDGWIWKLKDESLRQTFGIKAS